MPTPYANDVQAPSLACGIYFPSTSTILTAATIFVVMKSLVYFAFVRAFRYRVNRTIPMTTRQALKLAILRALLGVGLIGGGAYFCRRLNITGDRIEPWIYMYAARVFSWWIVGRFAASLAGRRLVGWIVAGTVLNAAIDATVYFGASAGLPGLVLCVLAIGGFIFILETRGRRPDLKARFAVYPLCVNCQYNLTGNLSGICPECGTPIGAAPFEAASSSDRASGLQI